jgi:hypothetical protein
VHDPRFASQQDPLPLTHLEALRPRLRRSSAGAEHDDLMIWMSGIGTFVTVAVTKTAPAATAVAAISASGIWGVWPRRAGS